MDSPKGKGKKELISRTWERCKSFSSSMGRKVSFGTSQDALKRKSKSWSRGYTVEADSDEEKGRGKRWKRVAPQGCFSIYVGPKKERFVIKTVHVNHPLFKILLEEAESEYGYSSKGPLLLPCEVDHFIKVLMELDFCDEESGRQKGCNFVARSHSSDHHPTPK